MKVGLIARAEDRGLGNMTWDFARNLDPYRVLVIDMGELARGFLPHFDRYGHRCVVPFVDGQLDEGVVRRFLDGLDVVYTAETWYDPRVPEWAADAGVATVMHAMPEFYRGVDATTEVWAPTTWRLGALPDDSPVIPVPVEMGSATHATAKALRVHNGERVRVVHIAGHRAAMDRNGTTLFAQAARQFAGVDVQVYCQDRRLPTMSVGRGSTITMHLGGVADRAELYDQADIVVIPRRYGGLCLPAQEALAHGCAVVMPNVSPNTDWPLAAAVDGRQRGTLRTPAGEVTLFNADPRRLAAAVNGLVADRDRLTDAMVTSRLWAFRNLSWGQLAPKYRANLARVAGVPIPGLGARH